MEKEKLDKYLRANGGLTSKQGTKFLIWSFFNFKKCLYFYQLCEEGTSNFVAFLNIFLINWIIFYISLMNPIFVNLSNKKF